MVRKIPGKIARNVLLVASGLVVLVVAAAALLLMRLAFFSGPVLPPTLLLPRGITDIHVHTAGIGAGGSGCHVSPSLRDSFKFDIYLRSFRVTLEELDQHGDQLIIQRLASHLARSRYVTRAVVLALDGVVDARGELDLSRTEMYVPNDFLAREVARYDNLLFGASINPNRFDAIERLERAAAQGAVLVKWIPSIMSIDPADQRIVPFYLKMKELGLLLLTHTGHERSFTRVADELADPARLHLPLSLGLTVIAAHVASLGQTDGQENIDRLIRMFDLYPTLYADISALTNVNRAEALNRVLELTHIHQRLVYGSDMPLINTLLVSAYYFPLRLTLGQMARIQGVENVWDRDVLLKQALGVPAEVFARPGILLKPSL